MATHIALQRHRSAARGAVTADSGVRLASLPVAMDERNRTSRPPDCRPGRARRRQRVDGRPCVEAHRRRRRRSLTRRAPDVTTRRRAASTADGEPPPRTSPTPTATRRRRRRRPPTARRGRRGPGGASCAGPCAGPRRRGRPSASCAFTVTTLTLVITTVVMMNVVHLNPLNPGSDLIFDHTTPTGGDMGAHVWGPAFLRDNLLPHFQLSGWSMDWYAGLPVYRFYMVVPALVIVALDVAPPVRRGVQARRRLRARDAAVVLLGVRSPGPLPLPDARAVRLRRAVLPARRELQHLRRQPQVDDGRRVLVLHRAQPRRSSASACWPTGCRRAGTAAGRRSCSPWPCSATASSPSTSCVGGDRASCLVYIDNARRLVFGLGVGIDRAAAVGVLDRCRSSATTST